MRGVVALLLLAGGGAGGGNVSTERGEVLQMSDWLVNLSDRPCPDTLGPVCPSVCSSYSSVLTLSQLRQ